MNNDISAKLIQLIGRSLTTSTEGETLRKAFSPSDLSKRLDVPLQREGISADRLVELMDEVVDHSVKTDRGLFMNQMYGKQQPVAVLADMLTTLLNTSMYTYEVAPVMTMIEKECIRKLGEFAWGGCETHDGVFMPGTSISNMTAMMMARNAHLPESGDTGLFGQQRFSIFLSDQAHYSFLKGAMFLGFGKESIVKVESDAEGRMDVFALNLAIEREKAAGRIPMMVVGVAGTTFSGYFDNLEALGIIAGNHDMWFHVDGAYGGSLMFSEHQKHHLAGLEIADSFAISLHKMMGVPLVCAALLTKHNGVLNRSFAVDAAYLFHDNDDFDLGQKSVQCGRRVDALKLWLVWKAQGDNGFQKRVDSLMRLANQFADKISDRKDFELLCRPESPIICFRFHPEALLPADLDLLNKKIRGQVFNNGRILFNYSSFHEHIYLRCVISDPDMKDESLELVLNEIANAGGQLAQDMSRVV